MISEYAGALRIINGRYGVLRDKWLHFSAAQLTFANEPLVRRYALCTFRIGIDSLCATVDDGRARALLCIDGTLPVAYKGLLPWQL